MKANACATSGCKRPVFSRGLCGRHYSLSRYELTRKKRGYKRRNRKNTGLCSACKERKARTTGLCMRCLMRKRFNKK